MESIFCRESASHGSCLPMDENVFPSLQSPIRNQNFHSLPSVPWDFAVCYPEFCLNFDHRQGISIEYSRESPVPEWKWNGWLIFQPGLLTAKNVIKFPFGVDWIHLLTFGGDPMSKSAEGVKKRAGPSFDSVIGVEKKRFITWMNRIKALFAQSQQLELFCNTK